MSSLALAFERSFPVFGPLSFGHMGSLFREMDRWVANETISRQPRSPFESLTFENNADEYRLKVDLPGLTKEDISLSVHEGVVELSCELESKAEADSEVLIRERRSAADGLKFSRSVRVPKDVDEAGVVANMKNGVLTIRLPKKESAKPRDIPLLAE